MPSVTRVIRLVQIMQNNTGTHTSCYLKYFGGKLAAA